MVRLHHLTCRRITISGLPSTDSASQQDDGNADAALWPSVEQLTAGLRCRIGAPINSKDIDADRDVLLATGLFGKVCGGHTMHLQCMTYLLAGLLLPAVFPSRPLDYMLVHGLCKH